MSSDETPPERPRRRVGEKPAPAKPKLDVPPPIEPPAPPRPGEVLRDRYLVARGVTEAALARELDVSLAYVSELVRGKRRVTTDTAIRLGRATGIDANEWVRLQHDWDVWREDHPRRR